MQWDASEFGGFSQVRPWLPLADDARSQNVENQRKDPSSIYNLYCRLISTRRSSEALLVGAYRPIVATGDLLLYARESEHERVFVALNLRGDSAAIVLPNPGSRGRILVSCFGDRDGELVEGSIDLRPDEGLVISLTPDSAQTKGTFDPM
jgi:alpha-glucosidase